MQDYIECQFHRNCGGYCDTEEEIMLSLCANCLQEMRDEERRESEIDAKLALLVKQRDELLAALEAVLAMPERDGTQQTAMARHGAKKAARNLINAAKSDAAPKS
ncbi:MAG: hypothetical protein PHV02_03315 [Rhodocyclaceae bacterium]|nr:hypothetical protein [Rhodocyclaceae bacterium]